MILTSKITSENLWDGNFMDDRTLRILEKEIDLIQSCINRMAQNSFIVRGWAITLITFALALISKSIDLKLLCGILLVVAICFWYLDAFFLKMERMYRWKYEWVITNRQHNDAYQFDLNPYNKDMWATDQLGKARKEPQIITVMFSKTLIPVYVTLILLESVLFVYSLVQ